MKIILGPTITPVGYTKFVPHPIYEIPDDGNDHVKLGAFAAKGCYDSFGKEGRSNRDNQKAILEHRHGSVLEHATVSLFIEGVTRGLTLEMNRHRTFAISQRSTRYTNENDAAIVLEPFYANLYQKHEKELTKMLTAGEHVYDPDPDYADYACIANFLLAARQSFVEYANQVDLLEQLNPLKLSGFELRKWARGKARNILPHALETRATYTNNHRGWRWFIESRSDKHAEPEIRRLADRVLATLRDLVPEYYSDFEIVAEYDGIYQWKPQYNKV